jgi:hypothetical protein
MVKMNRVFAVVKNLTNDSKKDDETLNHLFNHLSFSVQIGDNFLKLIIFSKWKRSFIISSFIYIEILRMKKKC